MKLNTTTEMDRAYYKGIIDKVSKHDPDLTYQEWVLYWCLRIAGPDDNIDMDETYNKMHENDWINEKWFKTPASKTHKMEVTIPWEHVFDL